MTYFIFRGKAIGYLCKRYKESFKDSLTCFDKVLKPYMEDNNMKLTLPNLKKACDDLDEYSNERGRQ